MVGRQDQRGADQRGLRGRDVPGDGELLVNGKGRDRLACHGSREQAQDAHPGFEHRAPVFDPARMIPARRRRQEDETPIHGRERGRRGPGGAQGGRHRRQVLGVEGPVVAVPQELRDLLERCAVCQPRGVVPTIVQPSILDQSERGFEHRCSEVERVGRDRFGLAADGAASLQA